MKRLRYVWQEDKGAEAPEWIAMTAVILVLLLALSSVSSNNGAGIGLSITTAIGSHIERWTGGGSTGAATNPVSGFQATANVGASDALLGVDAGTGGQPSMASGQDETGGFVGQVGGFFKGVVVDGVWGTLTSVATLVKDGVIMLPHTGDLVDFFVPGTRQATLDKYQQLWAAIQKDPWGAAYLMVEPMVTAWQDGEYGQAIGMSAFEVAMFFVPGDEAGKLGKLATLDRVLPDEVIAKLAQIEKMTPDELSALLKRTDQLTPEELAALQRRLDQLTPEELAAIQSDASLSHSAALDEIAELDEGLDAAQLAKRAEPWPCLVGTASVRKPPGLVHMLAVPLAAPCVKIDMNHLFHGEINNSGKAIGFHHRGSIGHEGHARIVPGTETPPNALGVYQAKVEVFDAANGQWVLKGSRSTFFPDGWNRQRVLDEIRGAFDTKSFPVPNEPRYWVGVSPSGARIGGYLDAAGNIRTAFPLL